MKSLLVLSLLVSGSAFASSSYEIRTNEEMIATSNAASERGGTQSAVESIVHNQATMQYVVTYSDGCKDTYEPERGPTEADGLRGMKLLSSKCE